MSTPPVTEPLVVLAPDGVGEVVEGDDLAALVLDACTAAGWNLTDGDIVAVTSKVVSKAEGRRRTGDRLDALADETVRVVARRGPTSIVRNHLGLTMAAAGIDASNVTAGDYLLLPVDPDRTAGEIRAAIADRAGVSVGVLVTDTAGRAWRTGQSDIAIGAAGVVVLEDFAGQHDVYGNPLMVTAPAVADELAGAAELAGGKLAARPFAVIRGRADLVLPLGDDGSGAAALIREDGADMFGYGSREAVLRALTGTGAAVFGSPAPAEDLAGAVDEVLDHTVDVTVSTDRVSTALTRPYDDELARLQVLAFAFGWSISVDLVDAGGTVDITFQPVCP